MAAVIATSSGRFSASLMSASVNAAVYDPGLAVAGPKSCIRLMASFSAGAWPLPLSVSTWTTIGSSSSAACRRACSSPAMSWPSIGPVYFTPIDSKKTGGSSISRMPARAPSMPQARWSPTYGTRRRTSSSLARWRTYRGSTRSRDTVSVIRLTVGA